VELALSQERFRVDTLLVTQTAYARLRPLLVGHAQIRVWIATAEQMHSTSGASFHQGCVALVRLPPEGDGVEAWGDRTPARVLVAEDVTDPDNIGGLFRNAFAFGVRGVLLSARCASPFYRKAARTSLGASLRVPFVHARDSLDFRAALERLRGIDFELIALTPGATAIGVEQLRVEGRLPGRLALCVGNEGAGLSDDVLARARVKLRIPMVSIADSVNVATAAAIALARIFELDVIERSTLIGD